MLYAKVIEIIAGLRVSKNESHNKYLTEINLYRIFFNSIAKVYSTYQTGVSTTIAAVTIFYNKYRDVQRTEYLFSASTRNDFYNFYLRRLADKQSDNIYVTFDKFMCKINELFDLLKNLFLGLELIIWHAP
jgi:hypothetical protein